MPQADSKNSSEQEQQRNSQTVAYSTSYAQQIEDDTIDFYEICLVLWKRKWIVIAVTILAAISSVFYALQQQHIYKAKALILPPETKDILSMSVLVLQQTRGGKTFKNNGLNITSDSVFKKFIKNLKSRNLHKKFIYEYNLMELLAPVRTPETRNEEIYSGFSRLIKIKEKEGISSISIESQNAEIAAQWINDLIEFVDKETVNMLVDDLRNSIENQIREVEYKISSKRQMAKQRREDQIQRYSEAAKIAEELGIKRRVDATNIIQNTQMNVDIATATTPLYYLGHEALESEISVLRKRSSDDPFIKGLRDLQEQLVLLNSIKYDKENMTSVQIDQAAYPPNIPIRPSRKKIVLISTLVGVFSGIFLVFLIEFVGNQRKKHS